MQADGRSTDLSGRNEDPRSPDNSPVQMLALSGMSVMFLAFVGWCGYTLAAMTVTESASPDRSDRAGNPLDFKGESQIITAAPDIVVISLEQPLRPVGARRVEQDRPIASRLDHAQISLALGGGGEGAAVVNVSLKTEPATAGGAAEISD